MGSGAAHQNPGEQRAYRDGRPGYLALSTAIRERGEREFGGGGE